MSAPVESCVPARKTRHRRRQALILLALVGIGTLVLLLANVHLVYVAFATQPECVPHLEDIGSNGAYRAAKSFC